MATPKMWLKRVLVPLWVIELIIMGIFFILAAIILGYANDWTNHNSTRSALLASGGTVMGLSGLSILLTLIEIGLLAGKRLNPTFHLVSACIKTVIWLFWFVLNIVSSANVGSSSALDIVLSLIVLICAVGQLIYGSIIVHRVRRGFYRNGENSYGENSYNAELSAYPRKDVSEDGRV